MPRKCGPSLCDLAGLTSRLPYLADLGVDALWIAPWYPSPLADGGYDITDYYGVDPRLGSLGDFVAMNSATSPEGTRPWILLPIATPEANRSWPM